MSNSPDPQTWIFPPLGAPVVPSGAAAAFGPVSKGDKIDLVWAPADEEPQIALICSNDGTTYTVSDGGSSSPFQYTFDQSLGDGTDNSQYICHFFFPETSVGNTVTFQYFNTPASSGTTWQQNSQVASALGGSAGSGTSQDAATATITQTVTATPQASTFATTVSNPPTTFTASGTAAALPQTTSSPATDASSQGSSISPGAAAGIAIAALLALLGIIAVAFLVWRRIRKDRKESQGPLATPTPGYGTEAKPVPMQQQGYYAPPAPKHQGVPGPERQPRGTIHEVEG